MKFAGSAYGAVFIYLSVCLSGCLSIHPSIHLQYPLMQSIYICVAKTGGQNWQWIGLMIEMPLICGCVEVPHV